MKTETLFSSKSDEWETPDKFFQDIDQEFHFGHIQGAGREEHMKSQQLTLLADAWKSENMVKKHNSAKRKWENAFQKWSNAQAWGDGTESYGACGYGAMCDWCTDNSYGRPCVRALNAMCREKKIKIDYTDYDFEKIWNGE